MAMNWAVGPALAYGLTYAGAEGKLQGLKKIDADTTRLALVSTVGLSIAFLGAWVNIARIQYEMPWPSMMKAKGDKNWLEYNAVQRAYYNFCEAALVVVPIVLVAAPVAPAAILVASQMWCWGKFFMSYCYAFEADTSRRFDLASWSYLFYFTVVGYGNLALLTKLGVSTGLSF